MDFGLHCKWSAQKKARPNKHFTFWPDFINPGRPLNKYVSNFGRCPHPPPHQRGLGETDQISYNLIGPK